MTRYVCTPIVGCPADHPDLEGAIMDALHRVRIDGVQSCRVYEENEGAQPEPTYRRMLTIIGPDRKDDE